MFSVMRPRPDLTMLLPYKNCISAEDLTQIYTHTHTHVMVIYDVIYMCKDTCTHIHTHRC